MTRPKQGRNQTTSTAHATATERKETLTLLRSTPLGSLPMDDANRLQVVTRKFVHQEPCWITRDEAAALLLGYSGEDVGSEDITASSS